VVLPVAASAAILVLPEAPPGLSPFVVLPMTLIAAVAWLAAVSRAVFERARTAR
jgi:hypothetical protein